MDAKDGSFGSDSVGLPGKSPGDRTQPDSTARWRRAMPAPALQRLRRELEARERELWRKITEERTRVKDEAQAELETVGDIVDRAFVTTQVTMERDLIDRCMTQLDEIARTRDRITNGEIGICIDCHETIESARLKVNPVASRCTECQMVREKEEWINAR